MESFFSDGGMLAGDGEAYVFRKQQLEYARAVENLISKELVGMIEGGTGVGKTLGYLVPHILEARRSGKRVLIATKTKNLQDQIFLKDLPRLAKSMKFTYAVLKGRENYICRDRLTDAMNRNSLFAGRETRALQYLEKFDVLHPTGDLEAASDFVKRYGSEGFHAIADVRATDDTCTSDHRGSCRHYKALAQAEKADVIIANHHLALIWPESYPEIDRLVIDEAHALEEAATDIYGMKFSTAFLQSRLRRLYSHGRRAAGTLSKFNRKDWAEFEIESIAGRIEEVRAWISNFDSAAQTLTLREGNVRHRIREVERSASDWIYLGEMAQDLSASLSSLAARLATLSKNISSIERLKYIAEKLQKTSLAISEINGVLCTLFAPMGRHIAGPGVEMQERTVLWYEATPARPVFFNRSSLDVGEALRNGLYQRFRSVLLTSATLQAGGDFAFLSRRLGLEYDAVIPDMDDKDDQPAGPMLSKERISEPVSVGHPFDYKSNVLLCLIRDEVKTGNVPANLGNVPAHADQPHLPAESLTDKIVRQIELIARLSAGRMLGLFTNKSRMQAVAERIRIDGVEVLMQYRDGSRHDLARKLQRNPRTVLLGAKSFWEGIDVPGENLTVVVMEKIPFTPPDEPVYEARCEAIGARWFVDYALPLALLALRQGFGRLIRTEQDRGVVVILDPGRSSYARKIISTLPECKTVIAPEETVLREIGLFLSAPAERPPIENKRNSERDDKTDDGNHGKTRSIDGDGKKDHGHEVDDEKSRRGAHKKSRSPSKQSSNGLAAHRDGARPPTGHEKDFEPEPHVS